MKKLGICGLFLAASVVGAPLAQATSPGVAGSWKVTFFVEPGRTTGSTQCIVFSKVPGTVAGESDSGTWTSPTFPGWSGQWVKQGDLVRWFGVTDALATEESGIMENSKIFGGVSFNHFLKTDATTSSAGSWNAVRVTSCSRVNANAVYGDPAH
ncbi:MAG TPA: hypothetical protein DDY37_02220 [Legionella sp.]|nr:hypothetical protein [Legionella sp.]